MFPTDPVCMNDIYSKYLIIYYNFVIVTGKITNAKSAKYTKMDFSRANKKNLHVALGLAAKL